MNNSLIPTPIVDKNGRATTVHRKMARTAASSSIPAPTVKAAKKAPEKPSTPLQPPAPIDPARLREYQRSFRGIQALSLRKNINVDEAALIKDILDNDRVEPRLIGLISDYMGILSVGERFADYDYNAFLLLDRYVQSGGDTSVCSYNEAHVFNGAIEGLYQRRRGQEVKVEKFSTEEELDANVAVLRMMVLMRETGDDRAGGAIISKEYYTADGKRLNGAYLRNQGFADFIRANYQSYHDIERYVRDRGVPKNKREVEALKAYVDNGEEHTTAMAEGWL